jgi:hypothetical protein
VKQEGQDVQGAMKSPYQGRGYPRKRRRVEGRVSNFLFLKMNLGDEIHFKGVGL